MQIVTGFQTGVDIAAVRAAKAAGLETGGAMPKGFLTLNGPHPEYAALYGAFVLSSAGWDVRTRRNVRDTEATFLFVTDPDSRGTRCAVKECERLARPCHSVLLTFPTVDGLPVMEREGIPVSVADIAALMRPFASINIGGNRHTWLEARMETLFLEVFTAVRDGASGAPSGLSLPDSISREEAFRLAAEMEARLKALTPEEQDWEKAERHRIGIASALAFMDEWDAEHGEQRKRASE